MTCFCYYNNNGLYQNKLNEMEAAGWNNNYTKKSKETARRYYNYYNNGVIPYGFKNETRRYTEFSLEAQVHKMIKTEYKRYLKSLEK